MAVSASEWLQWAIAFGVYPPNNAAGSVTSVDSGTGLTGGPITGSGILSFAPIAANSFWANVTGSAAVPTVQPLSAFTPSTLTSAHIFVGNASNVATSVAMSGDVSITNAGATTVGSIGGHAVSFAGSLTLAGAFGLTLTSTNTTNATLPAGSTTLVPTTGTGATGVWSGLTGLGSQSQALNMNSHLINFVSNPIADTDAVNLGTLKTYAQGLNPIEGVYSASTANLTGYTYDNGASGVGATLTAPGNGVFTQDGVSPPVNGRWLYKNDTDGSGAYNGVYTITTSTGGSPAVLTRATDYDTPAKIGTGDFVAVANGTLNQGSTWVQTATVTTVGVSPITYSEFFNPANYVTTSLASAHILVGNGSNIATSVAMSGDVSIDNTGATTVNSIGGHAVSFAGALTTSGAFGATFTFTGATNVTFPTSGTLATTAGNQCVFAAQKSANSTGVTGEGTLYSYICDTVSINIGSNYNGGTGVFTAPSTGNYVFNLTATVGSLAADNSQFVLGVNGTIGFTYVQQNQLVLATLGTLSMTGTIMVHMTAGDTIYPQVDVYGHASKNASVLGGGYLSSFSGYIIN